LPPQTALAGYLSGAAAWPDMEHNVLAHALDENLWDLELPSLAHYREQRVAAREATPDTGRSPP
jgi:hypothetical protein